MNLSFPGSGREVGTRPRFHEMEGLTLPDSCYHVRVVLVGSGSERYEGESEGTNLAEGRMRAGAEATLQALDHFLGGAVDLTYRGARTVRAFDQHVVVVALRARSREEPDTSLDLIGCVAIPDRDLARGAALAVLNASNRLVEGVRRFHPPEP
jgi:hypothetical protein